MRLNADENGLELCASGVRNTVGFDWYPDTWELWFTDNGRDCMGQNLPPEELRPGPSEGNPGAAQSTSSNCPMALRAPLR